MALIKYGGGITQMSGSIAGNTFARNRYGNYVRSRTKPVNPNTDAQAKIRATITYLTTYWAATLGAAQRTAWNIYASNVSMKNKLGETINLSGFNHFIRSNAARLYNDRPVVPAGPTDFTLPEKDETLTIDADETPQRITFTIAKARAWNQEHLGYMFVSQGIPQNGQRYFFAGPWHMLGVFVGAEGGGEPKTIPHNPYYALAEGQKCWCRMRVSRADGRLSEPWIVSTTVHSQAIGEVPMLIGLTQAAAVTLLTSPEVQLVLGTVTTINSETVPVDLIISSDPVVHTMLNPGDPVDIVVSLGPAA